MTTTTGQIDSMNTQALSALSLLNELKDAAFDALKRKHKNPALLLLYSFIDICATLADRPPASRNRERFESYLRAHALCKWTRFSTYDLWAARCSLLHAYSPLGDHTERANGAKALFYYSWPERPDQMADLLRSRGYKDFVLVDVEEIKTIAVSAYNTLWMRVDQNPEVELVVSENARHLLRDSHYIRLEQEMERLEDPEET